MNSLGIVRYQPIQTKIDYRQQMIEFDSNSNNFIEGVNENTRRCCPLLEKNIIAYVIANSAHIYVYKLHLQN